MIIIILIIITNLGVFMASGKKEVPVASNDGDSISGYGRRGNRS